MELTKKEQIDFDQLNEDQQAEYLKMRENGTGHNMAVMLASKEGSAGTVKGSRFPCPKHGRSSDS